MRNDLVAPGRHDCGRAPRGETAGGFGIERDEVSWTLLVRSCRLHETPSISMMPVESREVRAPLLVGGTTIVTRRVFVCFPEIDRVTLMDIIIFDKLIDVALGLVTTFAGIFLVYATARPRVEFDSKLRVSRRRSGQDRYRAGIRVKNRLLPVTHLEVRAHFRVRFEQRETMIPVPLSRSEWFDLRQPPGVRDWNAVPRLVLDEIDWDRHLPPERSRAVSRVKVEDIMRELDAKLFVTVLATSAVFGVSKVFRTSYVAADIADSPPRASSSLAAPVPVPAPRP